MFQVSCLYDFVGVVSCLRNGMILIGSIHRLAVLVVRFRFQKEKSSLDAVISLIEIQEIICRTEDSLRFFWILLKRSTQYLTIFFNKKLNKWVSQKRL